MTTAEDRRLHNLRRSCDPSLQRAGFDLSEVIDVTPTVGRNMSGVYQLRELSLFVKKITGAHGKERYLRTSSFAQAGVRLSAPVHTAHALHHDDADQVLVYEYLTGPEKLTDLVTKNEAPPALLSRVGEALALFHTAALDDPQYLDKDQPAMPPGRESAVPIDLVEGSTIGQLDIWRLIQTDTELCAALGELRAEPFRATPIHGDLRADQILFDADGIWILDWEDLRWNDPARDIGALLGEVLYHQLRFLASRAGSEAGADVTDETILRAGADLVDEAKPLLDALWTAYIRVVAARDQLPAGDSAFCARVVRYVGWQLFDRAMAVAAYVGRISALEKALMGIGRNIILKPSVSGDVLGITGRGITC